MAVSQLATEARLRREMRGIAVHRPTGRLLCRPYHKFWHVGSRAETLATEVRELGSAPSLPVIEKLDGVMVQAFMVDGRVYLATRSGRTNAAVEAEGLLRGDEGQRWIRLCAVAVDAGYTPLFEFVSPALSSSYKEPALTLTALRHRSSGVYLPYGRLATLASRFRVPVVGLIGTWSPPQPPSPGGWAAPGTSTAQIAHELQMLVDSIRVLLAGTATRRHLEGCVLMLPSGLTLKLKTRAHLNTAAYASPPMSPQQLVEATPFAWTPQTPQHTLQFGPHSPPAPVLTDAPLAEAIHLLLACASDAAASPNATSIRVGHWAQPASHKRLSHAAVKILTAAERARRYPPGESAYARAEQVLADALALSLHVAQTHGAPVPPTGGYPVQQMHALLSEELGLVHAGQEHAGLGSLAVRQVHSWPTDLLNCARPRQPSPSPARGSAKKWGGGSRRKQHTPASGSSGAFETPLLASMLSGLAKSAQPSPPPRFNRSASRW